MQPKDTTQNEAFKGFTNTACPFYPCHKGVETEFNCLFCYCPLIAYECPGPYKVFTDKNGLKRKDCSDCILPHNGYRRSWNFIQKWLERPVIWDGHEQTLPPVRRLRAGPGGAEPADDEPDEDASATDEPSREG